MKTIWENNHLEILNVLAMLCTILHTKHIGDLMVTDGLTLQHPATFIELQLYQKQFKNIG